MKNFIGLRETWKVALVLLAGLLMSIGGETVRGAPTNRVWHNVGSSYSFIRGTPAFGDDGTIYIASGDDTLYAFNPDGTTNHVWNTGSDVIGSPAIGSNGTIYVATCSPSNRVWAFNPDGTTNFAWSIGYSMYGTPAIGADGTIYVGDLGHKFYALNPADGSTSHVWSAGGDFRGHAAIAADGTIYVGNDDNKLYAFNPDGTTNRVWTMNGDIYHGPAISSNGTIYIGDQGGYFWAFNPDGTTSHVWKLSDMVYHSSAAIGPDGRIYVGAMSTSTTNCYCFALNPDGTTNRAWHLDSSRYQMNSPVIGLDGTVFIAAGYTLFGLNPTNGATNVSWYLGDDVMSGVTIGPDRNIYVGCEKGAFYSLAGILPMANTYWPRQHQNLKNTGLAFYAPRNIDASDGAYSSHVQITWDAVPQATAYLVYRSPTNTGPTLLGGTTSNAYADTTATAGMTYYYWLKATNASFTSALSDPVTGSRAVTVPAPRAPINVRASDGTYTNKIAVTWAAVSNAYAYEILRSLVNSTGTATKIGSATAANYGDYSAGIGATYYYWVRSVNDGGTSRLSASDSGLRVAEVTIPVAPQNLQASDGAYTNKVALSWTAVSNAIAYKIYRQTNDSVTAAAWVCDATLPAAQDTSVTVGTLYYYWVRAINSAGLGDASASDSGYAGTVVVAPTAPAGVAATKGAYTDRVRVSWTAVSNATAYEVWRNTVNDSASASKLDPDATSSPFDDATVTVDTTYYYWVKAKNDAGTSGFSSSDSGYSVTTVVAPSAPAGVAASKGAYTDRVRVSWSAVSNASAYEVWRSTTSDSASASKLDPDATSSPFDDTTVTVDTTYYYWVKAKIDAGASAFSSSDSGYAVGTLVPPSPPSRVEASKGSYTDRVGIYWPAATGAAAYEVWRSTVNNTAAAARLGADLSALGCEDATVVIGTRYYYWVKAKNGAGTSDFSTEGYGWCGALTIIAADFDGDGLADPALYVEWSGGWYVRLSASGYALATLTGFGGAGSSACVADFDGDRKTDPAVYTAATGTWQVKLSGIGYTEASLAGFGGSQWLAVAGDYDGDGLADPGIYHPVSGDWQVAMSSLGYATASASGFGGIGCSTVEQNYDSDRRYDAAIYNTTNGNWTVLLSAQNYITANLAGFGGIGNDPVKGDFDGDGLADPAIYEEATGTWQVRLSGSGYAAASLAGYGGPDYFVGAADFDGDRKADLTLLDLRTGEWKVKLSAYGYADATLASGWTP
jgi:outer membrane protein assembly factor BamB/fibronectin type 3 domain-containing protein